MIPALTFPDAELLVVTYLRAGLGALSTATYPALTDVTVGTKLPTDRSKPFVRVGRVGGVREGLFDQPRILLESWATTAEAAAANCDVVRDLMWRIPGVRSTFNVSNVVEASGPVNLTDPETGTPRYLLTVAFRVRAADRP